MTLKVNVDNALILLGKMLVERTEIEAQCEMMAQKYNELLTENETLKRRIELLESEDGS